MVDSGNSLVDHLVDSGSLDEETRKKVRKYREKTGDEVSSILLEEDIVDEQTMIDAIAERTECMVLALDDYPVEPDVARLISRDQAEQYRALPVFRDENTLIVAMQNPLDRSSVDDLEMITELEIQPAAVKASDLDSSLREIFGTFRPESEPVEPIFLPAASGEDEFTRKLSEDQAQSTPVQMANRIVRRALDQEASTIHIDPRPDRVRILFRVYDRMLHYTDLPREMRDSIVARFEVLAEQASRSGEFFREGLRLRYDDEMVTLRFNTVETRFGNKMVIQIRREGLYRKNLEELGFDRVSEERLNSLLDAPRGLILFAGPDNSGKKTTLYTSLKCLSKSPLSIVTVEDPVDFELDFCSQIQVPPDAIDRKADGIYEALNTDPDVLMVSDIGNPTVARATLEAAGRGLKVLSTVHADNSLDAVFHLTHKEGVDRFQLANSLIGVVSQRLLRIPAEDAREPYEPTEEELARLGLPEEGDYFQVSDRSPCRNPYQGVTGIYQVLPITNPLRRCILDGKGHAAFEKATENIPLETLRDKGTRKIRDDQVSIEEVLRMTFREDFSEVFRFPGDA